MVSADGVQQLVNDNAALNFEDTPVANTLIYIGTPISQATVDYFARNYKNIATSNDIEVTLPAPVAPPVYNLTIHNTDDSYSEEVSKNLNDFELPDILVEFNNTFFLNSPSAVNVNAEVVNVDDIPVGSLVAGKWQIGHTELYINGNSFDAVKAESPTPYNINVVDENDNPIGVTGGSKWVVPSPPQNNTGMPTKTGQLTSYVSNDDGDLRRGRGSAFNTLDYPNPYGDLVRMKNTDGTNFPFSSNGRIMIDWSSFDSNTGTVLGFAVSRLSNVTTMQSWTDWMTNSPYTVDSIGGFIVANFKEAASIMMFNTVDFLRYMNFSLSQVAQWTSTSGNSGVGAYLIYASGSGLTGINKTNQNYALLVRTFTLTELGL